MIEAGVLSLDRDIACGPTPMRAKPSPAVVTVGRSPVMPKWNVVEYPSSIRQMPAAKLTRVLVCRNWKSCGVCSCRPVANCSPG